MPTRMRISAERDDENWRVHTVSRVDGNEVDAQLPSGHRDRSTDHRRARRDQPEEDRAQGADVLRAASGTGRDGRVFFDRLLATPI